MERRHQIATGHGLMVQGGLLTTRPGSVHDGGEAPGGQSSLRQGAGKRCGGGTMEKFVILDMMEGFPIGVVNIGQRRASEEVEPT